MDGEIIVILVVGALFGWAGYTMAGNRNREQVSWGIASFLFGIFALGLLLLLGDAEKNQ